MASRAKNEIELVATCPGDFNLDSVVDVAGYTLWDDGLGTAFTMSHYETWKNDFGAACRFQQ